MAAASAIPRPAPAAEPGPGERTLTPEELKRFAELTPLRWSASLLFDWAWIASGFVLFAALGKPWILFPVFGLWIGCRQHGLALLGHDATHRLALPWRPWNDRIGEVLAGWPLGAIMDRGYRDWHFEHHRTLGTPRDPELAYRGSDSLYARPITKGVIVRRFLLDLIGLGVPDLLGFLKEILPERRLRYWGPVSLYAGLLLVCWQLDALWVFGLWCVSVATGFWATFRIRTWMEHVGLEQGGAQGSHRFSASPLERLLLFPHNTHCHYEHHLLPQVPYSRLPALREHLVAREGDKGRAVLPFGEVLDRFPNLDGQIR